MFQHLNVEHVFTRLTMYRLRETGHMDPVLNGQLMGKAKNGSTNGSTVCQVFKNDCKSLKYILRMWWNWQTRMI